MDPQAQVPLNLLALVAFAVGLVVRLLKADKMNELLAKFSIPPIPKPALPWLALLLGFVSLVVEAKIKGKTWEEAALAGFMGILAGTTAIAGHESLGPIVRGILGDRVADLFFGKQKPPEPPANTNDVAAAA